jgi:hypothetical protein
MSAMNHENADPADLDKYLTLAGEAIAARKLCDQAAETYLLLAAEVVARRRETAATEDESPTETDFENSLSQLDAIDAEQL